MKTVRCLWVEDAADWRADAFRNLAIEMRDGWDIELRCDPCESIEEAKEKLRPGQTDYALVLVDLLWEVGGRKKSRGLDVIRRAAQTPGVVVVAISVEAPAEFPKLHEDATEAGAVLFRNKHGLPDPGEFERLASDISRALDAPTKGRRGPLGRTGLWHSPGPDANAALRPEVAATELFVVCGRDTKGVEALYAFLEALGLRPLRWETLVNRYISERGGGGNPPVFAVVEFGFAATAGAIILFTPDDEARLRAPLRNSHDPPYEAELTGQPRPNVLLEAGYALRHDRDHTIIVSAGHNRPLSDLGGMHVLRLENGAASRTALAERLRSLGLAVDTSGSAWLAVGDFGRE